MKSAREFRLRAASFKVIAVAIAGDSLIAESAYRKFMHRNPMLLTNQKLKETTGNSCSRSRTSSA